MAKWRLAISDQFVIIPGAGWREGRSVNNSMRVLVLGAALTFSSIAYSGGDDVTDEMRTHVDLGEVMQSGEVQPVNNITSAGQPDEAALQVFADSGYVAVIDIRGPDENRGIDEVAAVNALDMQYIAFPIAGAAAISYENAEQLDQLLSEIDGPVLVHCGSGNRVGALLALRESLAGADDEQALEYGRSAGLTGLEPVVKKRLEEN
jgi:uncharacterized protein (TIGR01244 family)